MPIPNRGCTQEERRMKLPRWVHFLFTNPNSPKGLLIRAEKLEEEAEKLDGEAREKRILYARVLSELALKDFSPAQNKQWIKENLRLT